MNLRFKRVQEGMPADHEVVLIRLARSDPGAECWALAYYDGTKWCFEVPREVFDHIESYTGCRIPSGQDIVELGFSRVSYWAGLFEQSEALTVSDVEIHLDPEVRFNRKKNLIEIFGGSTNYTEKDPYCLEYDRFSTPATALRSLSNLSGKTWAASERFLHQLATVVTEALNTSKTQAAPELGTRSASTGETPTWDVFLCYAGEDKETIAFPLTRAISDAGFTCWYREVQWGDSLTARINNGLLISRYVIVLLSENFLGKPWPERELKAAMSIESSTGQKKILPLLAGDEEAVAKIVGAYPLLNDKYHLRWTGDSTAVVAALRSVLDVN